MPAAQMQPVAPPLESTLILQAGERAEPSPSEGTMVLPVLARNPPPARGRW